jgi:hypothetical protein
MWIGKRGSRVSDARRFPAFQPWRERLEGRVLLAIDLGGVPPATGLPNVATINTANTPPGPFGLVQGGSVASGGAGYQVTDVGNINGTGYDSFFIGAPSVTTNAIGNVVLGGTAIPAAYLVYGSQQVNGTAVTTFNWQNLNTTGQRVGSLGQLGNTAQTSPNPTVPVTTPGFPYAGIKFINNDPTSMLGASVSFVQNINGGNALLIGAPNYTGGGRAYLIYTNGALNGLAGQGTAGTNVVNLDSPTQPGLIVVTFLNSTTTAASTLTGASVTGLNNFFVNGAPAIAIGAPGATIPNSGLSNTSTGAVYVLPASSIPITTTTVDLNNVVQGTATTRPTVPGVLFLGTNTVGSAGFSLADAGDINGALTTGGATIDDLLIGAPGTGPGGSAYLIYGSNTLLTLAMPNINNVYFISLGLIGSSAIFNGAIFNGLPVGSNTGFSVAAAGDFNADGFADLMIGSPGNNVPTLPGQVNLIYGQAQTSTSTGIFGTINLSAPPTNIQSVTFTGPSLGSLAGFAESSLGRVNSGTNFPSDNLLIGVPGFNSNQGAVFLIPGDAITLLGTFVLSDATQPVAATEITISNQVGAPFLGASVSGGSVVPGQTTTIDNSGLAGMVLGAPGYNVTGVTSGTGTNTLAGGAFILQGQLIPVNVPVNVQITTQIGVGAPFSSTGVFTINATAPAALQIFVFSNNTITPPFAPVTQILPGSIKVNGIPFPTATITQDPVDENKDGIPDAIITISPRSNLNLTTTTTTLTITGLTRATGANANKTWGGTASILVTGAAPPFVPGTTPGVVSSVVPLATTLQLQFGPDVYVPPVSALSAYNYKTIPLGVAVNQYLPATGFRARISQYFFPRSHIDQFGSRKELSGARTSTLGRAVFTRGKFKPGKTISFTHEVRVIPVQEQHQTFIPTPNLTLVRKRSLA